MPIKPLEYRGKGRPTEGSAISLQGLRFLGHSFFTVKFVDADSSLPLTKTAIIVGC